MSAFDKTLTMKLNRLTQQIDNYSKVDSSSLKNLDYTYQDEIEKENKKRIEEQQKEKEKENEENQQKSFFDISLKMIYINFINTYSNILSDLIKLQNKRPPSVDEDYRVYSNIWFYIKDIIFIFFQEKRLLYVGIGFIIVSFFVYFIDNSK